MTFIRALSAVLVTSLVACQSPSSLPPLSARSVQAAPGPLSGASVLLEVKMGPIYSDYPQRVPQWTEQTRTELARLLTAAGYRVVRGPQEAHDLVATYTATMQLGAGTTTGTLEVGDDDAVAERFVDSVEVCCEEAAMQPRITWLHQGLINSMSTSRKVFALADRRRSRAPANAVASGTSTPPSPPPNSFIAAAPQPLAYALVIGIDRYRDVPGAPGARGDAEQFAALAKKTLGLKDDHVRVALEDHATKQDIQRGLAWLKTDVPAGGRIYFFFSGHGAPGLDQSTYLVPYDADARDITSTGLAISDVLKDLGAASAKEALVIVDACFSGAGGRSILPPGTRPLMRVKEDAPSAQLAVFSASQGDEISGAAPGENAGVFTKYVLAGLGSGQADIDGDGQISLRELSDWVSPRVAQDARRDKREQHPKLVVGSGVGDAKNFIVEYGIGR